MPGVRWLAKLKNLKRFIPTLNQVLVLVVIGVFVYSRAEGGALPSFMFYCLGIVLLLAWGWTAGIDKRLQYSVRLTADRSQVGESISFEVMLKNPFWLGLPWLELSVEIPGNFELRYGHKHLVTSLGGRESRSLTLQLICHRRGYYPLGRAKVRLGDVFGIFVKEHIFNMADYLIVFPRIIPLERLALPAFQMLGSSYAIRAATEDLTGPTGVRRYVAGDPVNRIHWKATARTGQLQVKEYDLHTTAELAIFLDLSYQSYTGLAEEILETGITVAASVAGYCREHRVRYGFVSNGATLYVLPPARDAGQLLKTLEHLALAEVGDGYLYSQTVLRESVNFLRGTTLLFITPVIDSELTAVLQVLAKRGWGLAVIQLGEGRVTECPSGIRFFGGVTEANLAQILGGEPSGDRYFRPGA